MALLVDDDVVRLQVPKYDVLFVQSCDSKQDFLHIEPGFLLSERTLDLKVLTQVTPWTVVRNEEEVFTGLEGVPQLNDEWVGPHATHHVPLCDCIFL